LVAFMIPAIAPQFSAWRFIRATAPS